MGPSKQRSLALGITALVAATAACLPRGEPPAGRQVVADRPSTIAGLIPSNGDGVLRILVLRPGAKAESRDVYAVSVDAGGGPPSERLLVANLATSTAIGGTVIASVPLIDPSAAVWIYAEGGLVRVDAITGDRMDFGPASGAPSESGRRFVIGDWSVASDGTSKETLYEPDGRTTVLDAAPSSFGRFFGEDFYYLTSEHALVRLPPSGVPEQLATGVDNYQGSPTPDGTLLMLYRATSEPNVQELSVRDPLTGRETMLPFSDPFIELSTDGRWLLSADNIAKQFVFFDYRSGAQKVIAFPGDYPGFGGYGWRPGTFQIWLTAWESDNETRTLRVVSPDAPPISVPGLAFRGFTQDGGHWYSTATSPNETYPVIEVGAADDPSGPRHFLTPPGTHSYDSWSLADGRELLQVYTQSMERSDMIAVDLDTGERRVLAERGKMAEVGQTRFIGMFRLHEGRGDLTAVEIESGRQTILAPEFAATAFVEPRGADLVAPGAPVVYQYLARAPSPYDGLWVVNVP